MELHRGRLPQYLPHSSADYLLSILSSPRFCWTFIPIRFESRFLQFGATFGNNRLGGTGSSSSAKSVAVAAENDVCIAYNSRCGAPKRPEDASEALIWKKRPPMKQSHEIMANKYYLFGREKGSRGKGPTSLLP